MKVALSTKNNMITEHFGHCDFFVIYEVEDNVIQGSHLIKNPPHQKGYLPKFLKGQGIDVVIAGGIGTMAINGLKDLGINCYINVKGEASEVIERYINNQLNHGGEPCTDHH
ncbi:MAG: NifB/NifX family molybdenum-iron cluster-binding protein [Tenericutes bacterium]|jgi:predicted Fe-Mo cluster-binding NifX family protein|nr:NifB/NifX family molybdenum-iron cluster-binding protein [Mycoplasmatota bacterium]